MSEPWLFDAVGRFAVDALWLGAIIGAVAAIALACTPTQCARARYTVAACGLAALVIVPALTTLSGTFRARATFTSVARTARPQVPLPIGLTVVSRMIERDVPEWILPPVASADIAQRARTLASVLWIVGALAVLIRIGGGLARINSILRGATIGDPALLECVRSIADRMGVERPVAVVLADVEGPCTVGAIRPLIVLPRDFRSRIPSDALDAMIAHELAHIRHMDYAQNLAQSMTMALMFFHPVAWWLARECTAEREHRADEAAARVSGGRIAYARALAAVAERRLRVSSLAMSAGGGRLIARIERLAGRSRARRPVIVGLTMAALAFSTSVLACGPATTERSATVDSAASQERLRSAHSVLGHMLRDADQRTLQVLAEVFEVRTIGIDHGRDRASIRLEGWRRTPLTATELIPIAHRGLAVFVALDSVASSADTLRVVFSDYEPRIVTLTWRAADFRRHPERVSVQRSGKP